MNSFIAPEIQPYFLHACGMQGLIYCNQYLIESVIMFLMFKL